MKLLVIVLGMLYTLSKAAQLDQLTLMKRTSCLIISRNYVHSIHDKLSRLLRDSSETDQMSSIWKLYAVMGQMCQANINQSQMQEFYSDNEDFNVEVYYYLVEDIDLLSVLSDSTLTQKEQEIVQFHHQFDQKHNKEPNEDKDEYLIDQN